MRSTMMKKILVATDFSADADRALTVAIELAERNDGQIELVHASQPGDYALPPPFDIVSLGPDTRALQHAESALASRAALVRKAGVVVSTHLLTSPAQEGIVALALEGKADLVVVGSHGHTGLAHVLLGSIAERIVRHAPCPILVVPHPASRIARAA
jgi:nucleotide-binding universal stress UspA family protein